MMQTKQRPEEAVDERLVKALGHPLRARALSILNERVASPNEIAKALRVPVSKVSYHVTVLLKYECIELVDTAQRRGATEHYYRGTTRALFTDADWEQLSPEIKNGVSIEAMKMITEAAKKALQAGTFDSRSDRHLSCTPVVVDEQGWDDLASLLADTLDQVMEIQTQSAGRLVNKRKRGISATVSMLSFESPG